jgi:hypothetical protein
VQGDGGGSATAGGGTAAGTPSRPIRADDLSLVLDAAAEILEIWRNPGKSPRERAGAVASDLPYRTLRDYLTTIQRCVPSDAEVVRAIVSPDSGVCGLGLHPAWNQRAALDSLVREVAKRGDGLRRRVASDAAAYLPHYPWEPIRVYFVVASSRLFDAVTLEGGLDGGPSVVLFNVTEVLEYGASTSERASVLERVLAHETFHAAVRQMEEARPGWARYHAPATPLEYIERVLLDEGVAHYIDWKERDDADTLFTARPGSRERKAFESLATACRKLRDPRIDAMGRGELIGMAASGPMWGKYGAVSGMFAAWRIERAQGRDSLRAAVVAGPRDFLRRYAAVAAADTALTRLPKELWGE